MNAYCLLIAANIKTPNDRAIVKKNMKIDKHFKCFTHLDFLKFILFSFFSNKNNLD